MESDHKQAHMRWLAVSLSLMLLLSLLMSALPQTRASAVTCKFKHTVAAGDTLSYVANLYQVDWLEVAQANNLQPPYAIAVGQTLCIPGGVKPDGIGTTVNNNTNGNTNSNKNGKNGKGTPALQVVSQMNNILLTVENFTPRTPYYVRLYARNTGVSYRIGNFTTNKEGDWSGWYKVPRYMPRISQMTVCVKNTWTDAVSCVKYEDAGYTLPFIRVRCTKEGR